MTSDEAQLIYENFKAELQVLKTYYDEGRQWDQGISRQYERIRDIFAVPFAPHVQAQLLSKFKNEDELFEQRALYGRMYLSYEKALSERAFSYSSFSDFLFSDEYLPAMIEIAYAEYKAADIGISKKLLSIGTGAVPIIPVSYLLFCTAEKINLISELLDVLARPKASREERELIDRVMNSPEFGGAMEITGIDCDREMYELSKKFVAHFGINHISLICDNGKTFRLDRPQDKIIFSGIVQEKELILRNILSQSKACEIVIRTVPSDSLGILLYEPLSEMVFKSVSVEFPLSIKKNIVPDNKSDAINATTLVLAYEPR